MALRSRPLANVERAYREGAWRDAAARAKSLLLAEPGSTDAKVLLARAEARLGRNQAARDLYSQLDPPVLRAEDYYLIGRGLIAEAKPDEGTEWLDRALKLEPRHAETLAELIRINRQNDRLTASADQAATLSASPGFEARGLVLLGLVQQDLHDPLAASQAFRSALVHDPKLAGSTEGSVDQVRKWLARNLLQAGKPAEARTELESSPSTRNLDPEGHWLLSRAALQLHDVLSAREALQLAKGFNADHPEAFEPAPYVGISRCQECHAQIFIDQRSSRHAQTFRERGDLGDVPLPGRPRPDPARPDVTNSLDFQGRDLVFRTHKPNGDLEAIVQFVMGSGNRGMTLVGEDSEGGWHELRLSYYRSIAGWDHSPGHQVQPQSPNEYLGVPQDPDMLRRCLSCHTTRARTSPNGRELITVGGRGFDCERCHGPAGNHLAAVDVKFDEPAIGRPRLASSTVVNALCAQCHTAEGHGITSDNPNLARFPVTGLALSRCSTAGSEAMSCLVCHSPHRNAETVPAYYEARCLACHSANPVSPTITTARAVCPVNPTKGCIPCHMPKVETEVPHTRFTDHRIH